MGGAALVGERHDLAVEAAQRPGILLTSVPRILEAQPGLVPRPVGIIAEAGERAVDPGRTDLEPVAALDRVVGVEPVGQSP